MTQMAVTDSDKNEAQAARVLPKKKKPLGWFFYLSLVMLVIVLAAGGLYGIWYYKAQNNLERQIALAKEKGEPVWFADLRPKPIPEDQNGAPLFLQAIGRLHRTNAASSQQAQDARERAFAVLQDGDAQGRYTFQEPLLGQVLADNQESLALFRLALQRSLWQFNIDYDSPSPSVIIPEHQQWAREFSRLLAVEFVVAMNEGDAARAVQAVDDGLRLSEALRSEPLSTAHTVRFAMAGLPLANLQVLARTELTPDQFSRLDARLKSVESGIQLKQAILCERAGCLTSMQEIKESGASVARPRWMEEQAFLLQRLGELAECADGVGPQSRALQKTLLARDNVPRQYVLAQNLLPAVESTVGIGLRLRQAIVNARLGLRVARRFQQTQQLPGALSDVLDEEIPELPACVYSGKPLIYKVRERGFSIYAPGDNGIDDGGGPQPDQQEGRAAFRVNLETAKQ